MKIQLICGEEIVSAGIRELLERIGDEVVLLDGSSTGEEGLRLAERERPEIALVAASVLDPGAYETIRRLGRRSPLTRVLLWTTDVRVSTLSLALDAGARGVVCPEDPGVELVSALRSVIAGRTHFCSEATASLTGDPSLILPPEENPVFQKLTPRERHILAELSDGRTSKEIAHDLHISSKTVDTHRRNVQRKLGARGLADLVKHAIRSGLTTLEP